MPDLPVDPPPEGDPNDANIYNKPGEPSFAMKVDPVQRIIVKYKVGEAVINEIRVTNNNTHRQCVKLKVSDNMLLKVLKVRQFCEIDETITMRFVINATEPPEQHRHFLTLYHTKCDKEAVDVKEVFSPKCRIDGVCRVVIEFEEKK